MEDVAAAEDARAAARASVAGARSLRASGA